LQRKPHAAPSQVAVALVGVTHGEHDAPQDVTWVLLTHWSPQR
jgi:hypothetical protein